VRWQAQRDTAFAPPHPKRRRRFALPALSKEKEAGHNARPLVCVLFLVKPTKNYFLARPTIFRKGLALGFLRAKKTGLQS